jgi:hypothetical protein
VQSGPGAVPVSVEATVPYGRAILHLGIHNLPPEDARAWLARLNAYTVAPEDRRVGPILNELARLPEVLIVLVSSRFVARLSTGVDANDISTGRVAAVSPCGGCILGERHHRTAGEVPRGLRAPQWSWNGLQEEARSFDRGSRSSGSL